MSFFFAAAPLAIPTASAITYPPTSSFLYGNSSVDQVGKTSLVAGSGLPYRYLIPKNYDPALQYPVIVFLHGQGQKGTNNTSQLDSNANGSMALVATGSPDNQTQYPCFFVAPQCSDGWDNKTGQIQAILNTLNRFYSIDQDRVCLTAVSMGALSSWSIVAALPNTFSALVPLSGGGGGEVSTMPRIPIWAFHAENDSTVVCNSTDQSVSTFRGRGFPVIYTRYSTGGHVIWSTAYQQPQLPKWIASQRRGQPMQGAPEVAIASTQLGASPMKITGSTTTSNGIAVSRVGWCRSNNGGLIAGTDGLTDGTTTFRSASANFSAANLAGYRIGIRKKATSSTTSTFMYDVASVTNATTLVLGRTSSSDTTARSYTLYRPGGYSLLNPAPGTTANDWQTWSVDVPVINGTQTVNVMAEFASGSSGLGGNTSYNLPLNVTYSAPTGDTQVPALSITTPTANPAETSSSTVKLSGSASDNVGVVSVSYSSDRGASGTAAGTTAWSALNVPLSIGLNLFTVTAKDAKGNTSTVNTSVVYAPSSNVDTTPPNVAITSPTSNPADDSTNASISVGGTASDDAGVTTVTWTNAATSEGGTANGTSVWTVSGLTLAPGANLITITAIDSSGLTSSDSITITYIPISATPTVNAGLDQSITLPGSVILNGTASDDGLPVGFELSASWSKVSGPGEVTFANPDSVSTSVSFSEAGTYELQLAVSDSQTVGTDKITIIVNPRPVSNRVRFDFGISGAMTTAVGWNNITNYNSGSVSNAKDVDGALTTIGVSITQPFEGTFDNGSTPAGLYTQPAMRDCFLIQTAPAKLRLSGLNPQSSYKITLYAYRNTTATDHVSRYTIGSLSQTLNAAKNTASASIFTGIMPDAGGTVEILVDKNAGSSYGYLSVLEVQN